MAHYRCRVSLPYITGIPSDVAINDFSVEATTTTDLEGAMDRLVSFYNDTNGGQVNTVADYLSEIISRTPEACRVDAFDRAAGPGAGPIRSLSFTLATPSDSPTIGLPEEVAACVSFHGDLSGLVNRARRRGRVFLGPFNETANEPTPGFGSQMAPSMIADLVAAGETLMADLDDPALNGLWEVWSVADGAGHAVVGGYVDDSWDTRRSRGRTTPTRSFWP